MKSFNFKKLVGVFALGLVAVLGMTETANAQTWRNNQKQERKIDKQQEKMQKQRARMEQQRILMEQQRQAEWNRQNSRSRMEQQRLQNQRAMMEQQRLRLEQQRLQNQQRSNRNNSNVYANNNNRYRVYRNGAYYNTDNRGAELLRQAVNSGYQQGFRAGQQDRDGRRNSSWNNSSVYRDGSYGYQTHVARNQYQYYFQQGFQKGYQDGYNSYDESQYRYGSNNGGSMNILSTILQQVLNIKQY